MSYARRVWPLVDALSERGWSLWWDPQIAPGSGFEETIDLEISEAACVLVIWSETSVKSRWVRSEALDGLERDVLVPVLFDAIRTPVAFRQIQAADLTNGVDCDSPEFTGLVAAISKHVQPGVPVPPAVPAPPKDEKPTFVVLPFRMEIDGIEDRFLIEGLNDGITARLARIPGFFAVSSSSTLKYLGQDFDSTTVGKHLGVRYVVDGTLRRTESRIRVAARLTDVDAGHQLWSQNLETESSRLDAAEEQIVRELVASIEPELARAELSRSAARRTEDMDAWALYRQAAGLFATKGWREDSIREAVAVLELAIERDPGFALGHALKSVLLGVGNRLAFWSDDDTGVREMALQAADTALQLDESDPNVLGFAGCTLADFGVEEQGMAVLDKAIELDPSNAQAYAARAALLVDLGRLDEAVSDCEKGLSLSPRDPRQAGWMITYVQALMRLGRTDEAVEIARFACRRDTRNFASWLVLAIASTAAGDPDGARRAIEHVARVRPDVTIDQIRHLLGDSPTNALGLIGLFDAIPSADS